MSIEERIQFKELMVALGFNPRENDCSELRNLIKNLNDKNKDPKGNPYVNGAWETDVE